MAENLHPLVSILIPTYGQAHCIGRAIESAQALTYEPLEIVVCDDASPDQTEATVQTYLKDTRVKYFRNSRNLGRVGNYRQSIFERAKGEWLLNLDGDDYLLDANYIEKCLKIIEQDPEIKFVFGRQYLRDESTGQSTPQHPIKLPSIVKGDDLLEILPKQAEGIANLSVLFNRKHAISRNVQSIDCIASDSESLFRMMPSVKVGFHNIYAGVWNYHSRNQSHQMDLQKRIEKFQMVLAPVDLFRQNHLLEPNKIARFKSLMGSRLVRDDSYYFAENRQFLSLLKYWYTAIEHLGPGTVLKTLIHPKFYFKLFFPGVSAKIRQSTIDILNRWRARTP